MFIPKTLMAPTPLYSSLEDCGLTTHVYCLSVSGDTTVSLLCCWLALFTICKILEYYWYVSGNINKLTVKYHKIIKNLQCGHYQI